VNDAGGGSYQTLLNNAWREYINARDTGSVEVLRRVVREELAAYGRGRAKR
jgi:hypothetical protein